MNGYTIPSYLQLQRLNVPNPCSPLYIFYYVLSLNCDTDSAPKYNRPFNSMLQYLIAGHMNSISLLFIRLLQYIELSLPFFPIKNILLLFLHSIVIKVLSKEYQNYFIAMLVIISCHELLQSMIFFVFANEIQTYNYFYL